MKKKTFLLQLIEKLEHPDFPANSTDDYINGYYDAVESLRALLDEVRESDEELGNPAEISSVKALLAGIHRDLGLIPEIHSFRLQEAQIQAYVKQRNRS